MFSLLALVLWGSMSFAQTYPCQATYAELDIVRQNVSGEDEFYYCFGYHHGRDRAWVMDYFRRSAQGTNAEVLGLSHLKSDLMMRLLDLPAHAKRIWSAYPETEKAKLLAYARGVNAGLVLGKKAREFTDNDYEPQSWSPENTLEVLLLQSFDQTRKTFTSDWEQEKTESRYGQRAAALMDNDRAPWENTILKAGEYEAIKDLPKTVKAPTKATSQLWANFPAVFGEESGSNNWVVSAKKSKTGAAMLANDPHLDLKTPLFWYWIHLKGPAQEVIGASLPGVPLVASGTNGNVAWGLTNSYINTADAVFISDLKDEDHLSLRPVVWFRFWKFKLPFFFKSFERTRDGHPVLPLENAEDKRIYLRWTGFNLRPQDISPMFALPKVKNVTEMDETLKAVGLPSWNFVFADTAGDIGYRLIGNAFTQTGPSTYGMKTMSYREFQETLVFLPEQRPHVLKPKREYVYSANNRHWPTDAFYNGGRGYSFSFRGNRIDELLASLQDVESFKKIQCDRQAVDAKYFLPKILLAMDVPELKNWDFSTDEESTAAPLYRRFMDLLMIKWEVNEYGLHRLLNELTDEMKKEMGETLALARKEVGGRKWGEVHRLGFAHLSKNEDWAFSPEISAPGDNHTVDPGTSKWNEDRKVYEHVSGASMRMIIEMEKRPRIHLVYPGFNRDYTMKSEKNPWDDWKNCRYTTFTM